MTRTNPSIAGRLAWRGRWLPILLIPAALIAGCGGSDDDQPPPAAATATSVPTRTFTLTPVRTATPTQTPITGGAAAACQKLSGCDQCFINERGVCISNENCAVRLSTAAASCINAVNGCGQSALGDCLPMGCDGGDDGGECE